MPVLDLDLDFFVRPTLHEVPEHAPRPADGACRVWSPAAALAYLERIGLREPLPGACCERHVEALWAWRAAVDTGRLRPPFAVVHVDAHEDLGYGDPLWVPLQEEVLSRPLRERRFEHVAPLAHSGNYLLCAVALGWVRDLTLVLPRSLPRDPVRRLRDLSAHALHFRDGDEGSGALQLKSVPGLAAGEQAERCRSLAWVVRDPPVPVRVLSPGELSARRYEFLTVARSPAFTPSSADALWPILTRWLG